jgi:hypothetical protein
LAARPTNTHGWNYGRWIYGRWIYGRWIYGRWIYNSPSASRRTSCCLACWRTLLYARTR